MKSPMTLIGMPFLIVLLTLILGHSTYAAEETPVELSGYSTNNVPLVLSQIQLDAIGQKIYFNETAAKPENLIAWNNGEQFASLGIGHFIWFPKGLDSKFTESFPDLIVFFKQNDVSLPVWLNESSDAPWSSQQEFKQQLGSEKMESLRALLLETFALQIEFIARRMQASLPKMKEALATDKTLNNSISIAQLESHFNQLAASELGMYSLIDYVNFKGEGTSPKERYKGQGWGLLQVLTEIPKDTTNIHRDFANACKTILSRRVDNSTQQQIEQRWIPGWHKRCETYSGTN